MKNKLKMTLAAFTIAAIGFAASVGIANAYYAESTFMWRGTQYYAECAHSNVPVITPGSYRGLDIQSANGILIISGVDRNGIEAACQFVPMN